MTKEKAGIDGIELGKQLGVARSVLRLIEKGRLLCAWQK